MLRPHAEPPLPADRVAREPVRPVAARDEQDTLVLVRHAAEDGPATSVTVLAAGPGAGEAFVLFVPVGTLLDIPGFGVDRLAQAFSYGGAPLVEASVENLLGVDLDAAAAVSDAALGAFLQRSGGVEMDVPERLVARDGAGAAEVRFEPGRQFLDGRRLAEYWGFRGEGEPELAALPRQQQVWESVLTAAGDREVLRAMVADGAPQLDTTAGPPFVRRVFRLGRAAWAAQLFGDRCCPCSRSATRPAGRPTRPDRPEVAALVARRLQASVPSGGGPEAVRVEVLNGVGTPGIGQAVDRRLEGAGFRIVASDNARSFDFVDTRIVVYDSDDRWMAAAQRVRERLGVGSIQLSRQPQSVVDITIVVGADFRPGDAAEEQLGQEQGT